jgi:hypothetical protein
VQREQRARGEEPAAQRAGECRAGGARGEREIAGERQVERAAPRHRVREEAGAEADHLQVAEESMRVGAEWREQDRGQVRAGQRPDREALDLVPQREQRHHDRARGEEDHPDAGLDQPIRPGGRP